METFLYVEINVIGLVVLTIILSNQNRLVGITTQQRFFNLLTVSIMLLLVADSVGWFVDGKSFLYARELSLLSSSLYYFLPACVAFFWLEYCECAVYNNVERLRRCSVLYTVPVAAVFLLLIANIWSGWIFRLDESNVYVRGPLFFLPSIVAFIYFVYASILALSKISKSTLESEKRQCRLMVAFALPFVVGTIVQTLFYGVSLVGICAVISLLVIFVNIQNRQISTDPLTGLNNRHQLDRFLSFKMKDFKDGEFLSLIMIDVDSFKAINDHYGHLTGDDALVCVAEILKKSCVNTNTFLSRYGGDEFTIVCISDTVNEIERLIETINDNVKRFNDKGSVEFYLSLSMGYSLWIPHSNGTIDTLVSEADNNMYEAKLEKKRTHVFDIEKE